MTQVIHGVEDCAEESSLIRRAKPLNCIRIPLCRAAKVEKLYTPPPPPPPAKSVSAWTKIHLQPHLTAIERRLVPFAALSSVSIVSACQDI